MLIRKGQKQIAKHLSLNVREVWQNLKKVVIRVNIGISARNTVKEFIKEIKKMPEHIAKIAKELQEVLITLDQMQENGSPKNAQRAFYKMACAFYGAANIEEYAVGIGQQQLLKGVR